MNSTVQSPIHPLGFTSMDLTSWIESIKEGSGI